MLAGHYSIHAGYAWCTCCFRCVVICFCAMFEFRQPTGPSTYQWPANGGVYDSGTRHVTWRLYSHDYDGSILFFSKPQPVDLCISRGPSSLRNKRTMLSPHENSHGCKVEKWVCVGYWGGSFPCDAGNCKCDKNMSTCVYLDRVEAGAPWRRHGLNLYAHATCWRELWVG